MGGELVVSCFGEAGAERVGSSGVAECGEDACFSFAGVEEEPCLLDDVFDGEAFGDAFLAAVGFGAVAGSLEAGFAGWFVVVAVAFECGFCSAGLGWCGGFWG